MRSRYSPPPGALIFCVPLLVRMRTRERFLPEVLPTRELRFLELGMERLSPARQGGLLASYKALWRTIRRLKMTSPQTLWFLIASAVFRDGLSGIFTFGGILAAGTFGFSTSEVILFGIAGSAVAAAGAILGGYLDDYLGPKAIIVISLVGIILAATPLMFFPEPGVFWVCALAAAPVRGPGAVGVPYLLGSPGGNPGTEGELFGLVLDHRSCHQLPGTDAVRPVCEHHGRADLGCARYSDCCGGGSAPTIAGEGTRPVACACGSPRAEA